MLCCLLLRMFHENLSLSCTCGKPMKGEAMCYCTPKREVQLLEACMWRCSGPHSAPSHPWRFPLRSIGLREDKTLHLSSFQTRPVPTVMHSEGLCMSAAVMCCLVNCLWCFTYNTYHGRPNFPQALMYQSSLEERPNTQQSFRRIILCVLCSLCVT